MRKYFLETERILFSHWTQDDINLAQLLWGEESVTRFISKNGVFTEKEIENRLQLELHNQQQYNMQYWPICEKDTEELIGCCGLRPYNIEKKIYEIGFHLRSKYWGKGYGTEAANAVIQYANTCLHAQELFAGHNPYNTNSKKMLEKLGFQYMGDEYYEPTGLYHPSYSYKYA